MNKKIYTLVRPVLDYEESENTFAAFFTEAEANAARDEIIAYWEKILEKIKEIGEEPDFHPYCDEENKWDEYEEWSTKRREVIDSFSGEWPFGSEEQYRCDVVYKIPTEAVEIRPLPLYSTTETYK